MTELFCRCWTQPANVHEDHCCMRPESECHVEEGRAAYWAGQEVRVS